MQLTEEKSMSNFVRDCLNGDALLDEIDDYIDQWHDGDGNEPIYNFLGLTEKEYSMWVQKPDILPFLVTAHKENSKVEDILSRTVLSMAARSDYFDRARQLEQWLKQKGLWD
ncbi:hypothetical protein [Hymenobacter norwichensis]|uniref:hypothetical protein n=1 Tax=Hymenobacter norwichensis TaxID=223903 RepID=UPI0003B401E1|nr:hypothetical protein [Hymenobacter norwichensis]